MCVSSEYTLLNFPYFKFYLKVNLWCIYFYDSLLSFTTKMLQCNYIHVCSPGWFAIFFNCLSQCFATPCIHTLTMLINHHTPLYIGCGLDCGVLTCFVLELNKVLKYVAHWTCRTSQGQNHHNFLLRTFERIMMINYHFNLKTNKKLQ